MQSILVGVAARKILYEACDIFSHGFRYLHIVNMPDQITQG
jgi:hypothetical protein